MTMTRRFSQTPPDKANELFEKLLASSDNATKARERLFQDLKEELELLANLQEEHLFPVLTQHGMQDLLQQATKDNQETAALLSELEQMAKNSAEFIGKVAELRQAFQQHIRDDRKELLPVVLQLLSDEEANAAYDDGSSQQEFVTGFHVLKLPSIALRIKSSEHLTFLDPLGAA